MIIGKILKISFFTFILLFFLLSCKKEPQKKNNERVRELTILVYQNINTDPKKAVFYSDELIDIVLKSGNERLLSQTYLNKGTALTKIVISDEKINKILNQLRKLEENGYYLSPSCTLTNLAKKANTNTKYLSKILKEKKEKNFNTYINELRIEYAINRLNNDSLFRKYTIKHIALEVGYKNHESFTNNFKKITGLYPSYYIKELNSSEES